MKTNLPRLCGLAAIACCLPLPAFCGAALQSGQAKTIKPTLTLKSTGKDLDQYVQYFRQQGYVVSDRHQELNSDGTVAAFHFHATRAQGKPTPKSQSLSVEAWATPHKVSERTDVGPTVHLMRHRAAHRPA